MQFTIGILHKAGRSNELAGDIAVCSGAIAVPSEPFDVTSTGHANERFDLLQSLHARLRLIRLLKAAFLRSTCHSRQKRPLDKVETAPMQEGGDDRARGSGVTETYVTTGSVSVNGHLRDE